MGRIRVRSVIRRAFAPVVVLSLAILPAGSLDAAAAHPGAPQGDSPIDRAVQLANQGHVEQAIRTLREHVDREPKDVRARAVLGRILDFDGRPDEAVSLWERGLTGAESDLPLLMSIGEIRLRQGTDGPTVTYRRGMVGASPSKDAAAEERFKVAHLEQAATAYEKARKLRPGDPDVAQALTSVYEQQKKFDAAADVWKSLVAREPKNGQIHLGLALATRKAGRGDEAAGHLRKAIELDPRLAEAHEALAEYQTEKGQAAEAELSRKQAEFYRRTPSFCHLAYSEENRKTLEKLNQKDTVDRLIGDPSETAAEFLATLCWSHPHNQLETRSFEALEARGDRTTPLLRAMLDGARSTCTVKSTAHILARRKVAGLFDFLVRTLPGDVRGFAMDMDIAGSLDDLGDPRAVGPLGQVLDPENPDANRESGPLVDREGARARAALALGAFDTPEARRLLDAGTRDPKVAAYCLAALLRSTKDPRYLAMLEKTVDPGQAYTTYVLGTYLEKKVGTDRARALAKAWEARRKADEARSKAGAATKPARKP